MRLISAFLKEIATWLNYNDHIIIIMKLLNMLEISYQIGEVFIHMTEEQTQEALEKAKELMEEEVKQLKEECEETQKILAELKIQLYAKFGDNINLEAEDN